MNQRTRRGRALARLLIALILVVLVAGFVATLPAFADDCDTDPFNAADCMRTGGFRQTLTILSALLGISPIVLAEIIGLTSEQIRDLISTGRWDPATELQQVVDQLRGGGPLPAFPDLPGPPGRPMTTRIYDTDKAHSILDAAGILPELRSLDPNDPH
ncbi:MAG: hypothetical protein MUP86_03965 [Dehalococcoidia bacterium]|nr:hypothetical protein [Dehalococcoidia bacterium]